jgi:hypothetical protein
LLLGVRLLDRRVLLGLPLGFLDNPENGAKRVSNGVEHGQLLRSLASYPGV